MATMTEPRRGAVDIADDDPSVRRGLPPLPRAAGPTARAEGAGTRAAFDPRAPDEEARPLLSQPERDSREETHPWMTGMAEAGRPAGPPATVAMSSSKRA
jgi:hypothetical protein